MYVFVSGSAFPKRKELRIGDNSSSSSSSSSSSTIVILKSKRNREKKNITQAKSFDEIYYICTTRYRHGVRSFSFRLFRLSFSLFFFSHTRRHQNLSNNVTSKLDQQLFDVLFQTFDARFQLTPFVCCHRRRNHRSGNPARPAERLFTRDKNVRHVLIFRQER